MIWPFETRRLYWPGGRVRDEYLTLAGLSVGNGWFPLALVLGLIWTAARPLSPLAEGLWRVAFGG